MRRRGLYVLLAAGLGLVLALSCGSCKEGADTTAPVTIEFWTSDSEQDRIEVQERLASMFAGIAPPIRVRVIGVPENLLSERLSAYKAGDRMPDVVRLGLEYVSGYARGSFSDQKVASGATLDTKAATEVIYELGEGSFFSGPLDLLRLEGGGYAAVPIDGWVQCLWYRQDWFAQQGLDPPNTWERIRVAAERFYDPQNGRYGIVLGTDPQDVYTQQTFEHIALSGGVRLFDERGDTKIVPDRLKEVLTFYRDLASFCPPGSNTWREARKYYLTGRAAMIFYSPYIVDDIVDVQEGDRPVTRLAENTNFVSSLVGPHGDQASYGQVDSLGITMTDDLEKRKAAKRWVKFLLSDAYLDVCFMSPGGKVPTRKHIVAEWKQHRYFSHYPAGLPERLAGAMDGIARWGWRKGRAYPLMTDLYAQKLFPALVGEVLHQRVTIEEAPGWIQDRIDRLARKVR